VSFKVPKNLQNGDYLFRHEIIALHVAMDRGAEYYPSCTQVRVSGGSNASLRSQGADFAKFPGEYNPNHPGLRINVFNNNLNAKNYKMPGPAKFVGSKQLAAPSSTDKPTSSPTPTPVKTETNVPKPSSTKSLKRCPARRNKRGELIKRSDSFEEEKRKHKRDHSRRLSH
jgi:cellulase